MAVPEDMTTNDISGVWVMNKSLSDSTDRILTLQGLPWYTRKIIGVATITVDINNYTDGDGIEHIDASQTLTGGIKGTQEMRVLNGEPRDHTDHLFGTVISISKRISFKPAPPAEVADNAFLRDGWTDDTINSEKGVIHTKASSKTEETGKTWTAEQTWGFEMIEGEKRYTRHVYFHTPEEKVLAKLVYDYYGPHSVQLPE